MKTSNNEVKDLNHTQPEEPRLTKMVMFSTGYFLNTFLMIAFNSYVWTFYEGELGLTFYEPIDVYHQFNALIGLRITQGLIPFIFCIVGALIFYKWFDLKGIKKQEVTRKLRELSL